MKKLISCILILFFVFFISIFEVKAAGIKTSSSTVKRYDKITITLSGLESSRTYRIVYPDYYITYINGTCSGARPSEIKNISGNCSFTFEVRTTSSTSASLVLQHASDGSSYAEDGRVNISLNPSKTTQKPQTTKKPSTTTTKAKSNNANIKTLVIKDQDGAVLTYKPEFKADVYEYSLDVVSDVTKIGIEAELEDAKANLVVSDNINKELQPGEITEFVLTVTAEDGLTKKAYNIKVKREALNSDALLKTLIIDEVPNFELKAGTFKYEVLINKKVKELNMTYSTSSESSKVTVTGNKNLKNGSVVKLLVTAEDGSKKEYLLNIIKPSETNKKSVVNKADKDPLVIIILSITAFALIGSIVYTVKQK